MDETFSEEVVRLTREIGERQARLAYLICGDQSKGVSMFIEGAITDAYRSGWRPGQPLKQTR